MYRYMVVLEKAEDGYGAYAPDVPGCVTTGATIDETLVNMKEALALWIEVTLERGEVVPEPLHQYSVFVEVEAPLVAQAS